MYQVNSTQPHVTSDSGCSSSHAAAFALCCCVAIWFRAASCRRRRTRMPRANWSSLTSMRMSSHGRTEAHKHHLCRNVKFCITNAVFCLLIQLCLHSCHPVQRRTAQFTALMGRSTAVSRLRSAAGCLAVSRVVYCQNTVRTNLPAAHHRSSGARTARCPAASSWRWYTAQRVVGTRVGGFGGWRAVGASTTW